MIIVIDIGGTTIKYGLVNSQSEEYELLGEIDTKTEVKNFRMENRLDQIIATVKKDYELSGIAISTAGIVNSSTGEILYANKNIPNYIGTNLKEYLEGKYDLKVSIENDVNAALLGELYFGKYHDVDSALMFTIGTGVGGALYLNNEIYHGFSHSAGEVGYSTMNGKNIEETASTKSLVNRVVKQLKDNKIDGRWIFEQAIEHKNPIAIKEINFMINELMNLVSNNVALINPELVILGGGIMEQVDYLKGPMIERFRAINKNTLTLKATRIEFASLGNKAGMLGAYVHFKNQYQ